MSIFFSTYKFTEPVPINIWIPPYRAGIYAVLIPDQTYGPKPYRCIYFRESSNMSDRGFISGHHKYYCWLYQAAYNSNNIYISTYLMPYSTSQQRKLVELDLINRYKPICNEQVT